MRAFLDKPSDWDFAYMRVTKTWCSHCKKMVPVISTEGHYICSECHKLTGFYINTKMLPATWSEDGSHLVTVKFELQEWEDLK